jgi:hypothetical protein
MTNTQFIQAVTPDLVRSFGSGRLKRATQALSAAGLCRGKQIVSPESIAWLLATLALAPSTDDAKLRAWIAGRADAWQGRGENPYKLLRFGLTATHLASAISAVVVNRTTGGLALHCADGSVYDSAPDQRTAIAEICAIDGQFFSWCAKAIRLSTIAHEAGVQLPVLN